MTQPIPKEHFRQYVLHSPFFERTSAANVLNDWSTWKGYTVANAYENVEYEYFAIRNTCSVFDITPMRKYRIQGKDAGAYLDRFVPRNVAKIKEHRVGYTVWCNDQGYVVDDGTIFHLGENDYRLCAQEHQLDWMLLSALGFDVDIRDETHDVAAVSFQGPTTCEVLKAMGLEEIETLKPFDLRVYPFEGGELMVSRTGYTGDLGYELWTDPSRALALWDRLFESGQRHGIRAIGSAALEIARIEAGFIQATVDFMPALETVRAGHARTPFELDLGWLVDLSKPNFTGRNALLREKEKGSKHRLVRLDIEGNKPATSSYIYSNRNGKHIGATTSATWSPSCKANLALAIVDAKYGLPGDELWAEIYFQRELRWHKVMAKCNVVEGPFWNPPRRRATPPGRY